MPHWQGVNGKFVRTAESPLGEANYFELGSTPGSLTTLPERLPEQVFRHIVSFLDFSDVLVARRISKAWWHALRRARPLKFPAVYHMPVELLQQIFFLLTPEGFNNARRTCKDWYVSSLDIRLQRKNLDEIGFSTDLLIQQRSDNPVYLSRRLAREFSLGAGGSGKCDLRYTAALDFSELSSTSSVHFTVSTCGSHALICEGCIVYVYRLKPSSPDLMDFVACIVCPRRVLAVSMDTSSKRYSVAILLDGRMGLVHDIVEQEAKCTYTDLCSEDDPPRSIAICPQRRCVAFGCQGGIELHWVDALTGQDLNRWFPLTAPTDYLYFLPPRHGIDSAKKLRLISSSVHPEEINPLIRRFGVNRRASVAYWATTSEPRIGQSDHFQAVPLSDGYNVLFIDPTSGHLCVGSDAPLGGPTKLLRKIWLIPPEVLNSRDLPLIGTLDFWIRATNAYFTPIRPSVYASGADTQHGLRVVAGYNGHIVFFSVPPDQFFGIPDHNSNGVQYDGTSNSIIIKKKPFLPEDAVSIHGSYIGTVDGLIDLAVHSGPEITVYAFSFDGSVKIFQLNADAHKDDFQIRRKVFTQTGEVFDENSANTPCMMEASESSFENGGLGWYARELPTWDGNQSETRNGSSRRKVPRKSSTGELEYAVDEMSIN